MIEREGKEGAERKGTRRERERETEKAVKERIRGERGTQREALRERRGEESNTKTVCHVCAHAPCTRRQSRIAQVVGERSSCPKQPLT